MPDAPLIPDKRRLADPDQFDRNPPAPYVELGLTSSFSFLRGASDPIDLVTAAHAFGYDALGIADRNTMAGVVRLHSEAKTAKITPVIGCRLDLTDAPSLYAYPCDRAAYGDICRLLSLGKVWDADGQWQAKDACDIALADRASGIGVPCVHLVDITQLSALDAIDKLDRLDCRSLLVTNLHHFAMPSLRLDDELAFRGRVRQGLFDVHVFSGL